MKTFWLILSFLSIQFFCQMARANDLKSNIGLHYMGRPDSGCINYEGYVLKDADNYMVGTAYCKNNYVIWLSKSLSYSPNKVASKKNGVELQNMIVLDQINVRQLSIGESFSSGPYCYDKGRSVELVAIYKWDGLKKVTKKNRGIVKAWVVDLKNEKLKSASDDILDSIYCESSSDE